MQKLNFPGTFVRKPARAAYLRIIVPVGLTFVLFVLSVFLIFIPSMEDSMMEQKREMIRALTDSACSLLDQCAAQGSGGELSLEDAQARAMSIISKLRYGPDGKDYFWINDMHPRMIMHPYRPDLDGRISRITPIPRGNICF